MENLKTYVIIPHGVKNKFAMLVLTYTTITVNTRIVKRTMNVNSLAIKKTMNKYGFVM